MSAIQPPAAIFSALSASRNNPSAIAIHYTQEAAENGGIGWTVVCPLNPTPLWRSVRRVEAEVQTRGKTPPVLPAPKVDHPMRPSDVLDGAPAGADKQAPRLIKQPHASANPIRLTGRHSSDILILAVNAAQPTERDSVLMGKNAVALWQREAIMHQESDSVLIARAKENPEDFGLLYERYVENIYNYIYYRTGNHHETEDLTARTFHRALVHFSRYVDRGAPFSAYLYRIAHNMVANWHRDRSRRQVVSLEEVTLRALRQEEPAAAAEEKAEQEALLRAIRRLPQERQQLLILKFVEQKSNAEIAQVMGRTEGAIKSLYHRTLLALRREMDADGENGLEDIEEDT